MFKKVHVQTLKGYPKSKFIPWYEFTPMFIVYQILTKNQIDMP